MLRLTSSESQFPAEGSHKKTMETAASSTAGCGDVETANGNQPRFSRTGNSDANAPPKGKPLPQYLIKWNRFEDQVCNAFAELFYSDEFVDVTLSCEGEILRAHQIVLGLSSPFFRRVLQETPCEHPVVIIKGIAVKTLRSILQYIYLGEVVLQKNEVNHFMDAADYLSICGVFGKLYSCDISAASTVDASDCKERDDSEVEFISMKYPEETQASRSAVKLGHVEVEAEKVQQSDCHDPKEANFGESESSGFKLYKGVKSRWHSRYNSSSYHGTPAPTSPTVSSLVNLNDQYKRPVSTGEMGTDSIIVPRDSASETGHTKLDETLVPVEAPRDVEMASWENDERNNEVEDVNSPEISTTTTRKIMDRTFHQRKNEHSKFEEFEIAHAQWEEWRNKSYPEIGKFHHSNLFSAFSNPLDRSRVNRHSGFAYPNTEFESPSRTYRDEGDLYNRKYTRSLDSTGQRAYETYQPNISLLSSRQFQDAHRHQEKQKSFPVSPRFSFGIGLPSSSSLTTTSATSGFFSASSSMNVTQPKTKAIRSSQVPQSSRYTAAEVDEMVDAVAHIPGNIVPCALCQKFVKRERLRSHIHECHLLTGEKIICPHCGIALKSKGSYRVHIWRHKRGDLPVASGTARF